MTDTLFITCGICQLVIRSETGEDGWKVSPSKAIKWHEATIAHIRREHLRKRRHVVSSN